MITIKNDLIRVSVRDFVDFALKQGDLVSSKKTAFDAEAMQKGIKLHQKLQEEMEGDYQAEVTLKKECIFDEFTICIEGRADGILVCENGEVVIDEIKSTYFDFFKFEEPILEHLNQAKCYAYLFCDANKTDTIRVMIRYIHIESELRREFEYVYTKAELDKWFAECFQIYLKWCYDAYEHHDVFVKKAQKFEFPFEYREGQRKLVFSAYKTMQEKKTLFVQAPTGIGKTMAMLFPAIRALEGGLGNKIFYVSAKTIAANVALEASRLINERGLSLRTVMLTAKEKLCFQEEMDCDPLECPYSNNYYGKIKEALFDMVSTNDIIDRETIISYAKSYEVCPFEMQLDATYSADLVIGDYNYVFAPHVRLQRFFGDAKKGDYIFLIDEAHNMVERARQLYSASLKKEDFLAIKAIFKSVNQPIANELEHCNKACLALKKECEGIQIYEDITKIYTLERSVRKLLHLMSEFFEETEDFESKEALELYFAVRDFIFTADTLHEGYMIYSQIEETGEFVVRLFCVDPSRNVRECLDQGNSAIFFSATLLPMKYYHSLLSNQEEDYVVEVGSPFPKENRQLVIANDVTTKYTRRTQTEFEKIADYILHIVEARKGNYMVFFPSYLFLEQIHEIMLDKLIFTKDVKIVLQERNMKESNREQFLEQFSEEETNETLIGLCVMGGIFSEGIDLTNDRLIGVIIVGTGLPQVCAERDIIRQYYDEMEQDGFSYAYLFPAINKVLQTAGRLIRTSEDRGVIALLDERFRQRAYQEEFPKEWDEIKTGNLNSLKEIIYKFWGNNS